jgi:predicted ATPase
VQLFFARTTALSSDFSPHRENLPAVGAICRRLDGIPLAIEFAAARAATLGLHQVASRLDDRFGLLTGGRRTALARHQTLRAALDWSYELLPEAERCLLRHLAIFIAGFTLEAAIAVMRARNAGSAVAEGIANLVAKSLVTLDGSAPAGRWRLLETTRAYALEKLADSDEVEQAARRHAEFFRDLFAPAASCSPLKLRVEDLNRYGREIDNVRAALDWCFSQCGDTAIGIELTAAYSPVWLHFALNVECRERTELALTRSDPDTGLSVRLRMQMNVALAYALFFTMGPVENTKMALATTLELAESLADMDVQLWALWGLWAIHLDYGECRAAQPIAERFSIVACRAADPADVLVGDRLMATTMHYRGAQTEARLPLERVRDFYFAPGNQQHAKWFHCDQLVLTRAMLARVLCLLGFVDQASDQAQASLREAQAADNELSVCESLRLAVYFVALMTGDLVVAEQALAMLIELATNRNTSVYKILGRCLEGELLIKRGEFKRGSVLLRSALDTCDQTGWTMCFPEFLGVLAEGLAGLRRITEALATVDRALAWADRGGECWCVAELERIKGEILLQEARDQSISAAESCFLRALELAHEQGALFWELRAALSLSRLWVMQDRQDDARQILAPVYGRFTEGFKTADLCSARAMLDS